MEEEEDNYILHDVLYDRAAQLQQDQPLISHEDIRLVKGLFLARETDDMVFKVSLDQPIRHAAYVVVDQAHIPYDGRNVVDTSSDVECIFIQQLDIDGLSTHTANISSNAPLPVFPSPTTNSVFTMHFAFDMVLSLVSPSISHQTILHLSKANWYEKYMVIHSHQIQSTTYYFLASTQYGKSLLTRLLKQQTQGQASAPSIQISGSDFTSTVSLSQLFLPPQSMNITKLSPNIFGIKQASIDGLGAFDITRSSECLLLLKGGAGFLKIGDHLFHTSTPVAVVVDITKDGQYVALVPLVEYATYTTFTPTKADLLDEKGRLVVKKGALGRECFALTFEDVPPHHTIQYVTIEEHTKTAIQSVFHSTILLGNPYLYFDRPLDADIGIIESSDFNQAGVHNQNITWAVPMESIPWEIGQIKNMVSLLAIHHHDIQFQPGQYTQIEFLTALQQSIQDFLVVFEPTVHFTIHVAEHQCTATIVGTSPNTTPTLLLRAPTPRPERNLSGLAPLYTILAQDSIAAHPLQTDFSARITAIQVLCAEMEGIRHGPLTAHLTSQGKDVVDVVSSLGHTQSHNLAARAVPFSSLEVEGPVIADLRSFTVSIVDQDGQALHWRTYAPDVYLILRFTCLAPKTTTQIHAK